MDGLSNSLDNEKGDDSDSMSGWQIVLLLFALGGLIAAGIMGVRAWKRNRTEQDESDATSSKSWPFMGVGMGIRKRANPSEPVAAESNSSPDEKMVHLPSETDGNSSHGSQSSTSTSTSRRRKNRKRRDSESESSGLPRLGGSWSFSRIDQSASRSLYSMGDDDDDSYDNRYKERYARVLGRSDEDTEGDLASL